MMFGDFSEHNSAGWHGQRCDSNDDTLTVTESRLLRALRLAGNADAAIAIMAPLAGSNGAAGLLPFLRAISALTENNTLRGLSKHIKDISCRS